MRRANTAKDKPETTMTRFFIASIAALFLATAAAHAETIKELLVSTALAAGQIPTVTDGDTMKIVGIRIRLTNYDSPELFSPKCPSERELAWKAKLESRARHR